MVKPCSKLIVTMLLGSTILGGQISACAVDQETRRRWNEIERQLDKENNIIRQPGSYRAPIGTVPDLFIFDIQNKNLIKKGNSADDPSLKKGEEKEQAAKENSKDPGENKPETFPFEGKALLGRLCQIHNKYIQHEYRFAQVDPCDFKNYSQMMLLKPFEELFLSLKKTDSKTMAKPDRASAKFITETNSRYLNAYAHSKLYEWDTDLMALNKDSLMHKKLVELLSTDVPAEKFWSYIRWDKEPSESVHKNIVERYEKLRKEGNAFRAYLKEMAILRYEDPEEFEAGKEELARRWRDATVDIKEFSKLLLDTEGIKKEDTGYFPLYEQH
ncbi:MAG: hypothetical protein R3C24_07165 [Cyanobacteriota/Melainabacteria group bacterium]